VISFSSSHEPVNISWCTPDKLSPCKPSPPYFVDHGPLQNIIVSNNKRKLIRKKRNANQEILSNAKLEK
jgi:hypothetical protein